LEIAEKLQRPQIYSSTFFAELLAARGRIELAAVVMGNLFYNRYPNRTWMAFQQAEWLKQLGRMDDANLTRRHAILIPCNDIDNLQSLREYGLKEDHLLMAEHFYSTCEPDAGRGRFAVNELIWAAAEYATLIEEKDPVRAANLYRVAQYDLASFLRFPAQPMIFLESEYLSLARQAIADKDRDKAEQCFRRAFAIRPNNIDAAIKLVPLAEKAFGQETANAWYRLHQEHHLKHLERWPKDAMVHNNLAWLMAKLDRDLPEAQKHARQATELKKNESTYLDTLGEVEFRLGNIDQAIELAMQCVQLNGLQKSYREQLNRFTAAKFNKPSSSKP
jgi:tetratricopeptide (TPR) repeat protein